MKHLLFVLLFSCSTLLMSAESATFPKCDCSRASIVKAYKVAVASLSEADVEPFRIAVRRIYLKCKSGDDFDLESFCSSLSGQRIDSIVSRGIALNEDYRKYVLGIQLVRLQKQCQLLNEYDVGTDNYEEQKEYILGTLNEMQRHVQGLRLPVFDDNNYFFEGD